MELRDLPYATEVQLWDIALDGRGFLLQNPSGQRLHMKAEYRLTIGGGRPLTELRSVNVSREFVLRLVRSGWS
jgi:hypothetical protein